MKKSVTKRIFGFDTLRFIAITLIVVYHVFPGALPGGFVAVESFFVLSGFLICQKLMRSKKKEEVFADITFLDYSNTYASILCGAGSLNGFETEFAFGSDVYNEHRGTSNRRVV